MPWRSEPTPYHVLVSEMMLQQTQVSTVLGYFERWKKAFPTIEALAAAKEDEVLQLWSGLGYYARARNLHRTAQLIVQRGGFPKNRSEWLEMPGVGPYTAGALLSIADNQPEPILDGNVERVMSRWRELSNHTGARRYQKRLWQLATQWVRFAAQEGVSPRLFNQALMELGATVCVPNRTPDCQVCPVAAGCLAFQHGTTNSYPPPRLKRPPQKIQEQVVCYLAPSHVLLHQLPPGRWRAGLWDFPSEDFLALLPGLPCPSKRVCLGTVVTQHVVTHHRIQRTTTLWTIDYPFFSQTTLQEKGLAWQALANFPTGIPTGSALQKTWKTLQTQLLSERIDPLSVSKIATNRKKSLTLVS